MPEQVHQVVTATPLYYPLCLNKQTQSLLLLYCTTLYAWTSTSSSDCYTTLLSIMSEQEDSVIASTPLYHPLCLNKYIKQWLLHSFTIHYVWTRRLSHCFYSTVPPFMPEQVHQVVTATPLYYPLCLNKKTQSFLLLYCTTLYAWTSTSSSDCYTTLLSIMSEQEDSVIASTPLYHPLCLNKNIK